MAVGVLGHLQPRLHVFGKAVNLATELESASSDDCLRMSNEAAALLPNSDGKELVDLRRDDIDDVDSYISLHYLSSRDDELVDTSRTASHTSKSTSKSSQRAILIEDMEAAATFKDETTTLDEMHKPPLMD